MANFNTNQTRHFYVAKAIDSNLDTAGDIYMGTTATGEFYFKYRNADGLLTRTDLVRANSVRCLKKTAAAAMNTPLMATEIAVDSSAVTLSNLVGKPISLMITLRQFMSYDESDSISIVATVIGDSTNTASAAAFYKALAKAVVNAVPKLPEVPFKVFMHKSGTDAEITKATAEASYMSDATSIILVPAPQKWIRGKMSNEPLELDVHSSVKDSNVEDIAWATVTTAQSAVSGNTSIPSAYKIADLEYFALGERGDVYRGSFWPNNYEPTYLVDVAKQYDMVSIEYFWQGAAENVQKSPRLLEIACEVSGSGSSATSAAGTIYDAVNALIDGTPSGSGSGSGAGA